MLCSLIAAHPALVTVGGYWLFSAVVGGMPQPTAQSSAGYTWLHNSLHILAGNLSSAIVARYPALSLPAGTEVNQRTDTTVITPPKT